VRAEEDGKRVVIAAGGTGGHLFPGIAVGVELQKRGYRVVFVVKKNDQGLHVVKSYGFEFHEIDVIGLPRKLSFGLFTFGFKMIAGFVGVSRFLNSYNPQVVVGMGAYVSFPALLCAKIQGRIAVVQEQNYVPGMANKVLSVFVDIVAAAFPESIKMFWCNKHKFVYTGTPIREMKVWESEKVREELGLRAETKTVLVFGGSLGAGNINNVVSGYIVKNDNGLQDNLQVIHLTGSKDYEHIKKVYDGIKTKVVVLERSAEMDKMYTAADVVLSRAGGSTLAELCVYKKYALLVPYPYATNDHQWHNAQWYTSHGVAETVRDNEFNERMFSGFIEKVLNGIDVNAVVMKYNMYKFPDGRNGVADIVDELVFLRKNEKN